MRFPASVVLSLCLAIPCAAQQLQGRLVGTVTGANGQPLQDVTVTLAGAQGTRSVNSSADGRFTFDQIAPGDYELRLAKDGFRDSVQAVPISTGSALQIAVQLDASYAQTVLVTSSRSAESLLTSAASVSVIGSRDIQLSPADNIADLLRGVPGLNVTEIGARDININTRGSTGILSNKMLVMVDGRSFFQPIFGAVYWDLLPITKDDVDTIEVLRTPGSAVWGANALNGVINLRTKSPRESQGFHGQVAFGNIGTRSAQASWADAKPGFSYKLTGSYFEQDAWERDNRLPDGSPMPAAVVFKNVGTTQPKFDARVDWDADQNRIWRLRGGIVGANGLIFSALGPSEFGSGSYSSYLELDHESRDLDVKLYWNRLDAPFHIVLFGLDEDSVNDTYVAEATRRLRMSNHALNIGGTVRADRFDLSIAPQDKGRVDLAAFAEDSITLRPSVKVVAGARVDKFDTTDAVFAPRLALVLTPTPRESVHVTYNRAFRAPSLLENFVNVDLPAVIPLDPPFLYFQSTVGSDSLHMERLDSVEAGYTHVLNSRTTVTATVYQQRIVDNIRFFPIRFYGPGNPPPGWPLPAAFVPPLPHVYSFLNLGKVTDRGVELSTHVEWARLSLQGAYTFQSTPKLENEASAFPLQINHPPRHSGSGRVTYATARWSAAADATYTDRAFWSDVFTEPFWGFTDSFVAVNGRVSMHVPRSSADVWVSATNLLDEKIKSHVFGDIVRRKVTAGVTWVAK
jgi:outer membrane receptor protein involved in Fe transport